MNTYINNVVLVGDVVLVGGDGEDDVGGLGVAVDEVNLVNGVIAGSDGARDAIDHALWTTHEAGAGVGDYFRSGVARVSTRRNSEVTYIFALNTVQ